MESGQGDQPAVYLEVVEAGSGTEVTSSDGQVSLVQEEMVIDNGNVRAIQWLFQMMLLGLNCVKVFYLFPSNLFQQISWL